ncbi:glucosamine-6-phosphate deaminase [Oceanihabitans sediminis]|uniref:glucosamine-6-phosphate deaminase n=1 Tax=Oceanihabitans sediminis TaxID=1812012 RepID=UPI0009309161|nr:glucosamine-6-phosphate deaminase [Oceanihabitans sediminis]MDX1277390.1 glucosamine-6-phosphate deaminase [Oceanihabitans sediminis]
MNYSTDNLTQVNLTLYKNAEEASIYTANTIAALISRKQKEGKHAVLGLATGNTPKRVYQELIRMHNDEGLSFQNVISFNLDEYFPINAGDSQSYTYFMEQNLFAHVDIKSSNIHIPHVDGSSTDISKYCNEYEEKIASYGGLDLQLLGIGRNGHIGFNEPGSSFDSITRLVNLHPVTREDAKSDFGTLENVPQQAISMGINTILQAKKILLLALGQRKSEIINKAIYGAVSIDTPASILQSLPQVEYILDSDAAALIQK